MQISKHYFSSNEKIHQLHIKGYVIAKDSFVPEVTLISGIIDYYFIMEIFLKNWEKMRTN